MSERRQRESERPTSSRLHASLPLLAALMLVAGGVATGCADDPASARPRESGPARWIDDSGLYAPGFGQVSFVARAGHHLVAKVYRSSAFDPAHGPVWFVMHGASRDVDRYIEAAAPVAERHDALAIAIHFTREAYPTSADYTLGIENTGADGSGTSRWRAPEDMLYAEIEYVFDAVLGSLGGQQTGYYLFGHSAGAQFTHRLLTFLPVPRVRGAVAANAGWYTLPVAHDPRLHRMPYGLYGGPTVPSQLVRFFETPFVVLLGEDDTTTSETDDLVRGTPEAEHQGATRLERGRHYYDNAKAEAARLEAEFKWRLEIVPRTGHDAGMMIRSAGFLTFVAGAGSCEATAAAEADGLVITEILADPPEGIAGDANDDGERDPADDEFVEIANQGTDALCLSGWMMGDAQSPDRHVFPLGPMLAPGQSLIVFGGGVPTGAFNGAQVQWSTRGLSLSNAGDVLTLRDVDDVIVKQVSWGDCAGTACATDHWSGELGINASLTRLPHREARWEPHAPFGGLRYSPGLLTGVPGLPDR